MKRTLCLLCSWFMLFQSAISAATYAAYEDWSQASGEPIGCTTNIATTGCMQFWTSSGSGEVRGASTCGSGWNTSNQIEIPHGASSPNLSSYGTMPYIPTSHTVDIYVELCYTSTTVTSSRNIIEFTSISPAGTRFFRIVEGSTGSGQLCVNNASPCTAVAVNNHHVLHANLKPGASASCLFVDAGSCVSFTELGNDFGGQIILTGDTGASAADLWFGQIYIQDQTATINCTNGTYSTWKPTTVIDFNSLSNGVTVTNTTLQTSVRGGNTGTASGAAVYTAGAGTDIVEGSTASPLAFASQTNSCGNYYTNNAGLSLQHHVPAGVPGAFATYKLLSNYPTKVVGFYFTPNSSNASLTGVNDQIGLTGSTIIQICTAVSAGNTTCDGTGSLFKLRAESTSSVVQSLIISNNTTYWITASCSTSGSSDQVAVYSVNPNGSIAKRLDAFTAITNSGCSLAGASLRLGAAGSENPGVNVDAYYSGVIVSLYDSSFPLLPPAGIIRHK